MHPHDLAPQPSLETARLRLRPFEPADAGQVQRLAGHPRIAAFTAEVPHPYEDGMAEAWIETHLPAWLAREQVVFALTLRSSDELVGAMGLRLECEGRRGNVGYWIGVPYWGRGYCTEALRAVLAFGFGELGLERIYAAHMSENPASGRVMQKAGMRHEGSLRRHLWIRGRLVDVELYGVLAAEAR